MRRNVTVFVLILLMTLLVGQNVMAETEICYNADGHGEPCLDQEWPA